MNLEFPGAVPEIRVSDLKKAVAYYESNLGFSIDWGGESAVGPISTAGPLGFATAKAIPLSPQMNLLLRIRGSGRCTHT